VAGTGKAGPEFTRLREGLASDRAQLGRAVADGAVDQIATQLKTISAAFDAIGEKSSAMNLMDRENMAIQLATGRRIIASTQAWVANADIDAIRTEVARLDGVLGEVDALLDRAIRSSVPSPQITP